MLLRFHLHTHFILHMDVKFLFDNLHAFHQRRRWNLPECRAICRVPGPGRLGGLAAHHHLPGHAHDHRIGRHGFDHHRVGTDAAVRPDGDIPQNLGAGANDHLIFDGGVAFALFQAGSAQGDAMIQGDAFANFGCFTNDHPHAVIDKKSGTDLRAGMDLDTGQEAGNMRKPARQQFETVFPKPVFRAVRPDGVQTGVGEQQFQRGRAAGSRSNTDWISSRIDFNSAIFPPHFL